MNLQSSLSISLCNEIDNVVVGLITQQDWQCNCLSYYYVVREAITLTFLLQNENNNNHYMMRLTIIFSILHYNLQEISIHYLSRSHLYLFRLSSKNLTLFSYYLLHDCLPLKLCVRSYQTGIGCITTLYNKRLTTPNC